MSEARRDGGGAYPHPTVGGAMGYPASPSGHVGMTLLDYFAAKAMQADVTRVGYYQRGEHMDRAAENAYAMAESMLKAKEARQK